MDLGQTLAGNPETALARQFQAITNPQAKKANLTNLVNALSSWERRQVRLQLGDSDGLARFEDLPLDIVCLILPYLLIEDVLACAGVSKRSRTTWTDPTVAAALCLRFFPGLLRPFTFSAFRKACRKYLRRRAGRFTSKLGLALPKGMIRNSLDDSPPVWDSEAGKILRPDPVLHPDGKYPEPWPRIESAVLECYGKGNVVWTARPDNLIVDNLYNKTRRVVKTPPAFGNINGASFSYFRHRAVSKYLVVFIPLWESKLFIYHIETNTWSRFLLPSNVDSMEADEGIREECPNFDMTWANALIYPHPSLPGRSFVTILGGLNLEPLPGKKAPSGEEVYQHPVRYLLVREYDGDEHVATYQYHVWKLQAAGLLEGGGLESQAIRDRAGPHWDNLFLEYEAGYLDSNGLYAMGYFQAFATDEDDLRAAGLPSLPEGLVTYVIYPTFNAITKEFGFQRYASPDPSASTLHPPWNHQTLVPDVPRPGVLHIRRFDVDGADYVPTEVSRGETKGERRSRDGWDIELEGLEEHMVDMCLFHHDEDFTVLFIEKFNRYFVWNFVEDDEEEAGSVI
ncbi:uncharacterized protein DNG_06325 [Cephalotrichum gorgonifer]|uniref:F-box domain-containing protein n=1 Tax=Cephalotrichum gorgonifer TaxID=2041049 RepID=A0AAE8N2J7_9PEZI|nr:uncharacterized protein DNG_06325 [Cephalotrichum gorgonifer]